MDKHMYSTCYAFYLGVCTCVCRCLSALELNLAVIWSSSLQVLYSRVMWEFWEVCIHNGSDALDVKLKAAVCHHRLN